MAENDEITMPTLDILGSTLSSLSEYVAPRDIALAVLGGLIVNFLWWLPAYINRRGKKLLVAHRVVRIPMHPTYLGRQAVRVEYQGRAYDKIFFNSYIIFNGTDAVITDASFIKHPRITIADDNEVIFKELIEAEGSGSGTLTTTDGQIMISNILLRPNEYLALTVATSVSLDMLNAIMPNQARLQYFEPDQLPRPFRYSILVLIATLLISAAFNSLTGLLSSASMLGIIWWLSVRKTPKKRIGEFFWNLSVYGTFHPRAGKIDRDSSDQRAEINR